MKCWNKFIAYITTVPERLHTAYLETGFVGLAGLWVGRGGGGGGGGGVGGGGGREGGRVLCLVAVRQSRRPLSTPTCKDQRDTSKPLSLTENNC